MPTVSFTQFTGLDLRRNAVAADMRTARIATNVDLTTGQGWRRRGGLRRVCALSANSVGLYSAGGRLRAAVPGGNTLSNTHPAQVTYDPISDGSTYAMGSLYRVLGMEVFGASATAGVFPYLAVQRTDLSIEHHWLREAPPMDGDATPIDTKVKLPFNPSGPILKLAGKLWAIDNVNGAVRFCSSLNGPTDWLSESDAGFLPVLQHASGERNAVALGYYNDLLAVFFADTIQLWQVDPDPAYMKLLKTLNGPGTDQSGTVENVLGDLYYFSRGGFRAMSAVTVTGEFREGDVGAQIQPQTQLQPITTPPIAIWSQARNQYLAAFGSTVYAFTNSPLNKVRGWSTWALPISVVAMVEHEGEVYIRGQDDVVYVIADDCEQDETASPADVTAVLRLQYSDAKAPGRRKQWQHMNVVQRGESTVSYLPNPNRESEIHVGATIDGATYTGGDLYVGEMSHSLAVQFSSTDPTWQLDGFDLRHMVLEGV